MSHRALGELLSIRCLCFKHEMSSNWKESSDLFSGKSIFFIEQRSQVSPQPGRRVCVRRVCRPFAIWMTRFSNQRICWPSLLGSPLLCCHILPSLLSSVSFVRRQAAADESSRGVSVPPRLLSTSRVSQQHLSQIYRLTKCCWHARLYTLNQLSNSLNSPL